MNVLKCRTRSYVKGFLVFQLRKSGDFKTSPSQFVAGLNTEQGTSHYDGIHIFTKSQCTDLACGYGFTVLWSEQQQLLVSGINSRSQLGVPSAQYNTIDKLTTVRLPFTKADSQILAISCGRLHTMVSTTEGLFAAGCNKFGQCGLGKTKEITNFTKVPWSSSIPVKQVVCGLDHTLVLTANGDIWSCGWGADGQTGLGHTKEQQSFGLVHLPSNVKIKKVATMSDSCLVLSDCGEVFAWGNSEYNQLGFSTEKTLITKPTKIPELQNVVDVAIGNAMGLALTDVGDVYTWGYGLLGNSSEPGFSPTPQQLVHLETRVIKVDCGLDYYVLFTDDKQFHIWGKLNNTLYSSLPKKVEFPTNIQRYSCGSIHIAITVDARITS